MKKILILIFTLGVLLSSCSRVNVSQLSPQQTQIGDINLVYPSPIFDENQKAYPSPIYNKYQEVYPAPINIETLNEIDIHLPSEGYSAVTGILHLANQAILLSNTTIYLTLGKGEGFNIPPSILIGPSEDNGDYASMTDSKAVFFIEDIIPGSYFLVASSSNSYSIIEDINGKTIQIILTNNELLELGDVYVTLP